MYFYTIFYLKTGTSTIFYTIFSTITGFSTSLTTWIVTGTYFSLTLSMKTGSIFLFAFSSKVFSLLIISSGLFASVIFIIYCIKPLRPLIFLVTGSKMFVLSFLESLAWIDEFCSSSFLLLIFEEAAKELTSS